MWQNPGGDCYGGWGVDQTDIDTSIFPSTEDLLLIPPSKNACYQWVLQLALVTHSQRCDMIKSNVMSTANHLSINHCFPPKNRFHLYNNPCPDHRELPELKKKKHVFPQKNPSLRVTFDPWSLKIGENLFGNPYLPWLPGIYTCSFKKSRKHTVTLPIYWLSFFWTLYWTTSKGICAKPSILTSFGTYMKTTKNQPFMYGLANIPGSPMDPMGFGFEPSQLSLDTWIKPPPEARTGNLSVGWQGTAGKFHPPKVINICITCKLFYQKNIKACNNM